MTHQSIQRFRHLSARLTLALGLLLAAQTQAGAQAAAQAGAQAAAQAAPQAAATSTWSDGYYLNEDYGYELKISGKRAELRNRVRVATSDGHAASECWVQERSSLNDMMLWLGEPAAAVVENERFVVHTGIAQYRWQRSKASPCEQKADRDPIRNLTSFAALLRQHDPFVAQHGLALDAWQKETQVQLEQALAKKISARKVEAMLAKAIAHYVAESGDPHFGFQSNSVQSNTFQRNSVAAKGESSKVKHYETQLGQGLIAQRKFLRPFLSGNDSPFSSKVEAVGGRALIGRVSPQIGYLALATMGGFDGMEESAGTLAHQRAAAELFDSLLRQLDTSETTGLILDLRYNQGGYDAVSFELASRFAASRTLAYTREMVSGYTQAIWLQPSNRKRFDKALAVLISPGTVSAGETAALALAQLPNVKLFGCGATQGAFSDAIPKTLPNGWQLTLSMELVRDPLGQSQERTGVSPDQQLDCRSAQNPAAQKRDSENQAAETVMQDIVSATAWLAEQ